MSTRERTFMTGESLRDCGSVLEETLLGKCVTVYLEEETIDLEIPGMKPWTTHESYVGTVERFEGDEYRHIVLYGGRVVHSVLLDAIDRIEL